jgi:beta-phosphoglucomutase-like phosphatase (HAD superfamily)
VPTRGFEGAIFDVDGVLVDSPHEQAWQDSLRELMENDWADIAERTSWSIEAGEFEAYPDALRFLLAVHDAEIPVVAASSSKNAGLFLRQIRLDTFAAEQGLHYNFLRPRLSLLEFFDVDISGRDFAQGKPHPEIFLTGAAELGIAPEHCFVVEDAASGVQAAKAGGMAALGLARADDKKLLAAANADLIVTSLDEVDVAGLGEHQLRRRTS